MSSRLRLAPHRVILSPPKRSRLMPSVSLPLGGDSTLHEWLEDERGRELIRKRDMRLLQDPELIKVIGTMPMHAGGVPRHVTQPRRVGGA